MIKKIAFVIPWYGENIPGGAEMELRGIAHHVADAGIEVEILTTCVEKFTADWNINYHPEGTSQSGNLVVRRFPVRKRDVRAFDKVNTKLMNGECVSHAEEELFIREMINSPKLYSYIAENKDQYDVVAFIPYMFGTTYFGAKECFEKAVMIPCFHDEAYIYMDVFKPVLESIAGMIYLAKPECSLANKVFNLENVHQAVLGGGLDTEFKYDAEAFRRKFQISDPFILYAGRKDVGKNIYTLIQYFCEYKRRNKTATKLVLIGGGEIRIPEAMENEIIDLGFVDYQDKYNAYAAALCTCQPSFHESFSLVVMESWLCERPVLVHAQCAVTRNFVSEVNGGLYFDNYYEFEGCVEYFQKKENISVLMGKKGRQFVLENFAWDVIVDKYVTFFEKVINTNTSPKKGDGIYGDENS